MSAQPMLAPVLLLTSAFLLRVLAGLAQKFVTGGDAQDYLGLAHNLASGLRLDA